MVTFDDFLKVHEVQLKINGVPEHFYQVLFDKLRRDLFDAGETFALLKVDYDDEDEEEEEEETGGKSKSTGRGEYDPPFQLQVVAENGIKANDSKHIYLIDHFWTFNLNSNESVKEQLRTNRNLRERLASLMGLDLIKYNEDLKDEKIYEELWKYADIYFYAKTEAINEKQSFWYVNDEVGSAVTHSCDSPNFKLVPFYYVNKEITYTLMFPLKDVEKGEFVTRNRGNGASNSLLNKALLLPWVYHDFTKENHQHFKPEESYFIEGHIVETLPDLTNKNNHQKSSSAKKDIKYKVYAEYEVLKKHLTDPRFQITDEEKEADILWYSYHFTNYKDLPENKFVNQFPFEHVLTVKDLLAITCRRNKHEKPNWQPETYNLREELPAFVSLYKKREANKEDNIWIIKPYNLARGLDIHITSNLNFIIRCSLTGPKIAQKYVTNPVLFHRQDIKAKVKFDIRYIVLLKNIKPNLEVYVYKNFFLRFSNKSFSLTNFDDYEQHFTVMNYQSNVALKKMLCVDFKQEWMNNDELNSSNKWEDVEKKIYEMIKEVFECATMEEPPKGIGESPQSRTLFGFDVMLEWDTKHNKGQINPVLLEVNWLPDCQRACDYYPDFYNDIFKLLFLDELNPETLQLV